MSKSYSIVSFGTMIAYAERTSVYLAALRRYVGPNSVVLDIGTGTGFFAIAAAKMGARHVVAVEPNDAISVAREMAQANNVADRITFIQDSSERIEMQERADVIISDLGGVLPIYGNHFQSIIDARTRLLKPGGVLIRRRDILWAAPLTAPEWYDELTTIWTTGDHGIDMQVGRRYATSTWQRGRLRPAQLIAQPSQWYELDYHTIDSATVAGTSEWVVEREAVGHGVALWFDGEADEGLTFKNGPGDPKNLYAQMLVPWPEAVELSSGDVVRCALASFSIDQEIVWRWRTTIERAHRGLAAITFDQNSMAAAPLSMASLDRTEAEHAPILSPEGEADTWMLSMFDGNVPLSEIARRAVTRFPDRYLDESEAFARAGKLADRYGQR